MDENKRPRSWLTFRVRDLLWAMIALGTAIGWWLEYRFDRAEAAAILNAKSTVGLLSDDLDAPWPSTFTFRYGDGPVVVIEHVPHPTKVQLKEGSERYAERHGGITHINVSEGRHPPNVRTSSD
jgi:hypothetical protein